MQIIIMGGTDVKISRDASMHSGMHRGQLFTFAMEGDEEEGKPMYINHWVERKVDKGREEIREEKQDRGGRREHQCLKCFISTFLIVISIN